MPPSRSASLTRLNLLRARSLRERRNWYCPKTSRALPGDDHAGPPQRARPRHGPFGRRLARATARDARGSLRRGRQSARGQVVNDFSALVSFGAELADQLVRQALELLPNPPTSYGKAAIVGLEGEV